ncbi:hypothetical protein [Streptomyces abyssalis]|uniref:hypothetical protein n=1 Tax=Streptomyces abyssalis TaxID=933944 RepID=UPI0030B83FDC
MTAMIHPDNAASARVARRLAFTPRREDSLFGKPVTVYALDAPAPGTAGGAADGGAART